MTRKRDVGELVAEAADGRNVAPADGVAGVLEVGAHFAADAYHEGERDAGLAAGGDDRFAEDAPAGRVVGPGEIRRQRDRAVLRVHALDPVGKEAAQLGDALAGEVGGDGITPLAHGFGRAGEVDDERVDAQRSEEALVTLAALFPDLALGIVEGVVGHDRAFEAGGTEREVHVLLGREAAEELPQPVEPVAAGVEAVGGDGGDDAAGGFANGGTLDEKLVPDELGLRALGHLVERGRIHAGRAGHFGDEIVVGQQLVYAAEKQPAKARLADVRVYVENGRV